MTRQCIETMTTLPFRRPATADHEAVGDGMEPAAVRRSQRPSREGRIRQSGLRRRLSLCTLLVAVVMVPSTKWAQGDSLDQDALDREEAIFDRSQDELLDYMKDSVAHIGQGHELAYKGFASWYVNRLLPGLDGAPPIEKVFRYLVEELFLGGVGEIIPYKGVFVVDILQGFSQDAYTELSASMGQVRSQQGFLQTLDLQLADYRTSILGLPAQFEADYPDLFEELMFEYLNEELETPGIHHASDYGMGIETRRMLREQGFPEPSEESARGLAESLLTSMVFEAMMKYHSRGLDEVWGPEHFEIDARIAARRVLYPDRPDYYCRGAGMLGMLTPNDCRR